jgi:hypothetical protein
MFVGLAKDRCEALLSSPRPASLQHFRCLSLLLAILANDCMWIASYITNMGDDAQKLSHALLWLFDAVTVAVEASTAMVKYGEHWVMDGSMWSGVG